MVGTHANIAGARLLAALAAAGGFTSRFLVLSFALLCYGSVPSTAVQTEYEVQLQEEIHSGNPQLDLRNKLRGAAQRRAGGVARAACGLAALKSAGRSASAELSLPQLSLGLALPLRL
ncbi:MAG TPA: hypothetical protein VF175_06270 [Lacipirellula sp.]